jgi:sporulation protein YqfC
MRGKRNFLSRIGAYLDLPHEVLPGGFSVLLSGGREVCVQGNATICSYSDERIRIGLGECVLCVEGKGLFCTEMIAGKLLINGTVTGLFIEKEGRSES